MYKYFNLNITIIVIIIIMHHSNEYLGRKCMKIIDVPTNLYFLPEYSI